MPRPVVHFNAFLAVCRSFALLAAFVLLLAPARAQEAQQRRQQQVATALEAVFLDKVDLRDVSMFEACRLLSDQVGVNIVPSEGAREQRVSFYVRDVDARVAVESLCRAHDLWFQPDEAGSLLRIFSVQEYRRNLGALQAEKTEFFTLLYPNANDVGVAIQNVFGDRVILRTDERGSELITELSERLSRFDLFDRRTQGLGNSFGGGGAQGQGQYYGNQNGLGVDTGLSAFGGQGQGYYGSENQQQGIGAAAETPQTRLDELENLRGRQVDAGEAYERSRSLLEGQETTAARLDQLARRYRSPIFVSIARRQNKIIVRTGDDAALDEIRTIVKRLDVPTALVLLEVRVLSIEHLDGASSFFDYQFAKDRVAGGFNLGDIAAPIAPGLAPAGTGLRAGEAIFQFVDENFAARIQALERDNRVRSVSTPVLLTANNEVSRLFVGREVPLNRSFTGGQVVTNDSATSTVTGSTAIEFRPVGTTLLITPNINADGTVTLRIVQETSNVDSTATVLVPSNDGFEPQTVNVVSSQSVSGTIVAKSDLAVVFGGLVEEGVRVDKEQVPILGDVPLLGVLFQRNNEQKTRREIIIVVRPFVLSTPSESEASSARLLEALGSDPGALDTRARMPNLPGGEPAEGAPRGKMRVHGVGDGQPK